MRASFLGCLISLLYLGLPTSEGRAKDFPAKPNIVFILIDDMGWKDVAANGSTYYRTPNVNRLASEGIRFRQAYAACAVCSPSRAAIMTGQTPARLHLTDWIPGEGTPKQSRFSVPAWTQTLKPAETLPAILRQQGYTTAAIGKWHLGNDAPKAHGFDSSIAAGHIGHPASYFWPYGKNGNSHRVPDLAEAGGKDGEYLTDRLTDEAVSFIAAQKKEKPFFLYLAHYAVHAPLMAKEADSDLFKTARSDGRQNFPAYAGMVKAVDDSVGRILAELKSRGFEDDTIVIFTSDNGGVEHFRATDNSPLRGGKGFPYEGGTRVPLIIRAPGLIKPGTVSDTPVIGTDFLPTLAHLAGVAGQAAPILDGVDIVPALRGEPVHRDALVWHYPHYWAGNLMTPYSVIRSGDWKLIRWYEYDAQELYNLADDPSERTDLAAQNPAKLHELAAKLDAILKAQGAQLPVLRDDTKPAPDPGTNPAHGSRFMAVDQ